MFEPIPETLTPPPGLIPAAVLVPLVAGDRLVYTVRSRSLRHHKGQISFPGGSLEAGETPAQAALREAWEEIALRPEAVRLLGALPPVFSPAGFSILPVVGALGALPDLEPNPEEVDEILVVPLEDLFAAPAYRESRRGRWVWHYPWRGYDIWGVTGNITHELLRRLSGRRGYPGGAREGGQ